MANAQKSTVEAINLTRLDSILADLARLRRAITDQTRCIDNPDLYDLGIELASRAAGSFELATRPTTERDWQEGEFEPLPPLAPKGGV